MQEETLEVEVIDESIRVNSESIRDSIRDEWIGAVAAQRATDLTKSAFQRAISHLLGVRGCRVDLIRRGAAQNTRYSGLAIELVKAHKLGDEARMQQLLDLAKLTSSSQSSGLVVVDHVATLEGKIANLRQTGIVNSELQADRLREKLAQISLCNQVTQQRNEDLKSARLLAARNRGIEQGLDIFTAEEEALEETLAHLRALKISGNQ